MMPERMTLERMLELLTIERNCVERAEHCDRNCKECGLVQDDKELIQMYDLVIGIIYSLNEYLKNKYQRRRNQMENTNVKLSPPWAIFYQEMNAMFKEDPEINIVYDEGKPEIKLFVENAEKADALMKLLPMQKNFGNVNLTISVIPADQESSSKAELFKTAFKDNPVFVGVTGSFAPIAPAAEYVMFQPKVVQFYTDDLTDAHGYRSTLYQEIAKDIFGEQSGLYYCTDLLEVH